MAEVKHVKMVSLKGTSNWHYWKAKMIDHLYAKDLYGPITGEKPAEMADKDWTKVDRKAMACLRQWVDEVVYHHVSELNSSKEIWDKLQDVYERKTAGNKTLLIRKLVNLRYKDEADIGEHLNEMKSIITQLARMKMTLDEEWQAILLLNTLPSSVICRLEKNEYPIYDTLEQCSVVLVNVIFDKNFEVTSPIGDIFCVSFIEFYNFNNVNA